MMKPSTMSIQKLAFLITLVISLAHVSEAAISCSDVIKDLRPCVNYLVSGSGKPPAACCAGASSLASAASTPADKVTACNCIKKTASSFNLKTQLVQDLPKNCGISLSISLSPSTDCSKIG